MSGPSGSEPTSNPSGGRQPRAQGGDRQGTQGQNRQGSAKQGQSKQGQGKQGSSKQGQGKQGSAKQGSGKQGQNRQGSGKQGQNRQGSGKQGQNRQGSGKQGQNRQGGNRRGGASGGSRAVESVAAPVVVEDTVVESVTTSEPEALGWSGVRRDYRGAAVRLTRRVMIVPAVAVVVLALLAGLVHILAGLAVLVVGAAATAWWLRGRTADGRDEVLTAIGAVPADPGGFARVHNLVDGLTAVVGVDPPEVRVIEDPALNALAVAHRGAGTIVLTTGLVEALGRIELEGVIAHLLASIRSGAAHAGTLGGSIHGASMAEGRGRNWWASVAGTHPRLELDLAAVAATRYPPGLCSALDRISEGSFAPAARTAANAHLWLVADEDGSDPSVDALRWRVAALAER